LERAVSTGVRPRDGTAGAVYVEFLIAFLPLLIFFLCLWQVSILFTTKLFVDHAASSGARAAAVIIAEDPNRISDNGGAASVNVLTGRRNRLVQDAVGLALLPLIIDGTVIFYNVQYPDPATPGGSNVMLEQKYPGMTADSVSMARVRVRAMMNCKIAFANLIMCTPPWAKLLGSAGVPTQTFFPPYVYVVSESIFPYQGASYAYDPGDNGGSQNASLASNTGSPLAAGQINGCFVAGTPVDTVDGSRPIEQVERGTLVLTRDEASGRIQYEPVLDVSVRADRAVVDVRLAEADTIRATPNHQFWTEDRGWVPAGELVPGEALFSARLGSLHVASVEPEGEGATVYNFEVQGTHTYFVGNASAWVHNQGQICPPGQGGGGNAGGGGGDAGGGAGNVGNGPTQRRNPGQTCDNSVLDPLQAQMHATCDQGGTSCPDLQKSPKSGQTIPCSEARRRLQARQDCLNQRLNIIQVCYGGVPDQRHINANNTVQRSIDKCELLVNTNCAPGNPMSGL
jgi:hypothetical protein